MFVNDDNQMGAPCMIMGTSGNVRAGWSNMWEWTARSSDAGGPSYLPTLGFASRRCVWP